MIIRIQGEGQYRLDDNAIEEVNRLDDALGKALEAGESEFEAALEAIEQFVRDRGDKVADEELVTSDVILPPADATADEVKAMLSEDGLIPG